MSDTLEIRSANGTTTLKIAPWQTPDPTRRLDYLDVALTATGLQASTRIYNLHYTGGAGTLPVFFHDIASNWRGWRGEKRWESIESDLKLTCTSTSLGSINVAVEFDSYLADPFIWSVRCSLMLESWQLDVLALQAKKVFRI